MECCGAVISVDRHHRRRALGRVASGSSCTTRGAARPKAAKTAAGMAATPRTAILAEDRKALRDKIQAVTKGDIKCYGAGGKRWIMVDAGSRELT